LGIEFVLVPKGMSWLGGGGGKEGDKEVTIAHDFYLGKYEVTQEEWQAIMGSNPSSVQQAKDVAEADLKRFPVEQVSWEDAQEFVTRLNERDQQAGWVYRLPTEVEWEYACRGGPLGDKQDSAWDFYFNKPTNQLRGLANFGNSLGRPCKVGSYPPNRLGLYDMHGNVGEWCDDAQATGGAATNRVFRGGGWFLDSGYCRAARSYGDPPSTRHHDLGLRLARVPIGNGGK